MRGNSLFYKVLFSLFFTHNFGFFLVLRGLLTCTHIPALFRYNYILHRSSNHSPGLVPDARNVSHDIEWDTCQSELQLLKTANLLCNQGNHCASPMTKTTVSAPSTSSNQWEAAILFTKHH